MGAIKDRLATLLDRVETAGRRHRTCSADAPTDADLATLARRLDPELVGEDDLDHMLPSLREAYAAGRGEGVEGPLGLWVPTAFRYVDRGLARASDWAAYTIHSGVYPIRFTTIAGHAIPGDTKAQASAYARQNHPHSGVYYGVADLQATKTGSYYQNQLLGAVSGHQREHHEQTTVQWRPYAYEVATRETAFGEWTGESGNRILIHHAQVVEMTSCLTCGAAVDVWCRTGCRISAAGATEVPVPATSTLE